MPISGEADRQEEQHRSSGLGSAGAVAEHRLSGLGSAEAVAVGASFRSNASSAADGRRRGRRASNEGSVNNNATRGRRASLCSSNASSAAGSGGWLPWPTVRREEDRPEEDDTSSTECSSSDGDWLPWPASGDDRAAAEDDGGTARDGGAFLPWPVPIKRTRASAA